MSSSNISWFHCGRCGSLFLSPAGESDERFCPSCGSNPSLGVDPPPLETVFSLDVPTQPEQQDSTGARVRLPSRKRKQSYLMVKLVLGWTAMLVAIVFVARQLWMDKSEDRKDFQSSKSTQEVESADDIAFMSEASPQCIEALSGFLSATSPEERNQFVSSPITTASRMSRFYSMSPLGEIDPATISPRGSSIIRLPAGLAIETQLGSSSGQLLDVAFVRENEGWKIDWDHFVRYSDSPWALFLAGSGEAEGEFRLLARERLAEERKKEDTISLVLYAPRFGYAGDTGFQSPEFLVKRDSRDGRLLEAAFALERSGKRVFGVRLPSIDPEGLIRIRAKIRRSESELKRQFEITDVIACHWYSSDDPGVEIISPESPSSSPEADPSPETNAETPAPPAE